MAIASYKGVDFSHYQNESMDIMIDNAVFFFHKATEGSAYVDKECERRVKKYANSKPCILYMVAVPNKTAKQQAALFVSTYRKYKQYAPNLGVAIDVENSAKYFPYNSDTSIIFEIAEILEKELNRRVIIYCGDLYPRSFYRKIRSYDYGLWVARYYKPENPAKIDSLKNVPDFWQYTSTPVDIDIFYGSISKLHSFLTDWNRG